MDDEFLRNANEIELRLKAEGMFATANSIRKFVNSYVCITIVTLHYPALNAATLHPNPDLEAISVD